MRSASAAALGERGDDRVDVALRHRLALALGAVRAHTGRADRRGVRVGRLALLADHADVPQLRHDRAARRVHRLGDLRPARQLLLPVEPRHPVALPGGLVADVRALGDDQSDTGGGTAGVVRHDVLTGHAARREHAGHRRHGDAVGDGQAVDHGGPGQDGGGSGRGVRSGEGHVGAPYRGIPIGMCVCIECTSHANGEAAEDIPSTRGHPCVIPVTARKSLAPADPPGAR